MATVGQTGDGDVEAAAPETERSALKERIYNLLDVPSSSWAATFVAAFILLCIVASTAWSMALTIPRLEKYEERYPEVEVAFVMIFTVEYCLRIWATPLPKLKFVIDPFNVIDLLAIAPFYIALAMGGGAKGFTFFRTIRLFRLLKAGKYSEEVHLIVSAMTSSFEALLLLMFFLIITAILFGAVMYSMEKSLSVWDQKKGCYVRRANGEDYCSGYNSIPEALYWAVTTITTVGYGDVGPSSELTRALSAITMVCGVLVLALPVTMIGVSFSAAWGEISEETKTQKALQEEHCRDRNILAGKLRTVMEELDVVKVKSQTICKEIGLLLAANIARYEGITATQALEGLSPSFALLSRAAIASMSDLESHIQEVAGSMATPRDDAPRAS